MTYKLHGEVIRVEEVRVALTDVERLYTGALRELYKIPGDAYLNDRNQMVCEERGWQHGSVGVDMLDLAPSKDVVDVLRFIQQMHIYTMKLTNAS